MISSSFDDDEEMCRCGEVPESECGCSSGIPDSFRKLSSARDDLVRSVYNASPEPEIDASVEDLRESSESSEGDVDLEMCGCGSVPESDCSCTAGVDAADSVASFYGSIWKEEHDASTSSSSPDKKKQRNYVDLLHLRQSSAAGACCSTPKGQSAVLSSPTTLSWVHPDVLSSEQNFGCGSPFPPIARSHLLRGEESSPFTVLDLGCGNGRDCFLVGAASTAALLNAPSISPVRIVGVDLTPEAIEIASSYAEFHEESFRDALGVADSPICFEFREGLIEDLSFLEDCSVDLVISNCVVNLSSSKEAVFEEVHRVLKDGAEMYFSDIFADVRLHRSVRESEELWGECVAGALYVEDYDRIVRRCGFRSGFRIVEGRQIDVEEELLRLVSQQGETDCDCGRELPIPNFYSLTTRLIKVGEDVELDETEEDYGHVVTFRGHQLSDDVFEDEFVFDVSTMFESGRPEAVSRNTAEVLRASRYNFDVGVCGDGETHYGRFRGGSFWDDLLSL